MNSGELNLKRVDDVAGRIAARCIRAASQPGDLVLDPFAGTATTGVAALQLGRRFVGMEIVPDTVQEALQRLTDEGKALIAEAREHPWL